MVRANGSILGALSLLVGVSAACSASVKAGRGTGAGGGETSAASTSTGAPTGGGGDTTGIGGAFAGSTSSAGGAPAGVTASTTATSTSSGTTSTNASTTATSSTNGSATTSTASSGGMGGATTTVSSSSVATTTIAAVSSSSGPPCMQSCSVDLHSIIDCHGATVTTCPSTEACDPATISCMPACTAAAAAKQSVGCEFYATDMDIYTTTLNSCFAAFVANTWNSAAHISVDFNGATLAVANFGQIPSGAGPSLTYTAYDATAGLAPGEVAILFLAGGSGTEVPCPKPTALQTGAQIAGTGLNHSFHITTDVPVVAYEINPYGGGSAAVTGASLLLPTSAWDTNYVAVTVTPNSANIGSPSMNVIAAQDNTTVTMFPKVAIAAGGGLPAGPANTQYTFNLNKGQMAQFTQAADLTGTILQSNNPIGVMAGQPCMQWPVGTSYCDHGEQMIPPVSALGNEYVGVMYRPRVTGDAATWRLVGTVDGTTLTYSNAVGGPATLNAGQVATFVSATPFDVQSQDSMHPFMMFAYMSGSQWSMLSNTGGYGDPDMVLSVPPQQYLNDYVFFTDPTYPETNLVIVRGQNAAHTYDDVTLDCAGVLTGWQTVGNYEWTRVDLITGNFKGVGNCTTGRHQMTSATPFGLWVWGWGTPLTTQFTANVSYGYPGGMAANKINQVVIPPNG